LRRCNLLFILDIENSQDILDDVVDESRHRPIPRRYSLANGIIRLLGSISPGATVHNEYEYVR
jgi:hypothetical protein